MPLPHEQTGDSDDRYDLRAKNAPIEHHIMAHLTFSEYTDDGSTAVQTLPANPELEPEGVPFFLFFFSGLVFVLLHAIRIRLYTYEIFPARDLVQRVPISAKLLAQSSFDADRF